MRKYFQILFYLLGVHVMGLLMLSSYRGIQYVMLKGMRSAESDSPVFPAFLRGLWFDNVIACYVILVPLAVLLLVATFGCYPRWLRRAAGIWLGIFYTLVFAVTASNIPYFAYFFKNIDASIFGWFGYVGTTAGMLVGETSYIFYFVLFLISVVLFVWGLRKLRRKADHRINSAIGQNSVKYVLSRLVITCVLVGLCIFGIRGRMGYNPIKISQAYYCGDPFLNQMGIAPSFNLITSILDGMRKENAELHLMPYEEAIAYTRHELGISGPVDSIAVLRRQVVSDTVSNKPNVVIILMESMSASLMQTFGQQQRLTPTLDSLYQQSLAFTRFYSAGIHTNHGITASLYSFPALMFRNLMKGTVTPHRSGIATVLASEGYHNMFFMTHESQYDNMNAFLRTNGYDEIYSQENYPREAIVNSFGVPDQFLFDFSLPVINRAAANKKPFLATLLTISNHPPYIIPEGMKTTTDTEETQIVEYADACIRRFIDQARQYEWFDNTIFVILADHGKLVGNMDSELPQSYNHIPCLIFGPGVPQMQYDGLAAQIDVMPTLLGLMHIGYTNDGFGIDLLRQQRKRVFYTSDTQLVARDSTGYFIYDPKLQREFRYNVSTDNTLSPAAPGEHFDSLRHYVFSMIQTAEYLQRHQP